MHHFRKNPKSKGLVYHFHTYPNPGGRCIIFTQTLNPGVSCTWQTGCPPCWALLGLNHHPVRFPFFSWSSFSSSLPSSFLLNCFSWLGLNHHLVRFHFLFSCCSFSLFRTFFSFLKLNNQTLVMGFHFCLLRKDVTWLSSPSFSWIELMFLFGLDWLIICQDWTGWTNGLQLKRRRKNLPISLSFTMWTRTHYTTPGRFAFLFVCLFVHKIQRSGCYHLQPVEADMGPGKNGREPSFLIIFHQNNSTCISHHPWTGIPA